MTTALLATGAFLLGCLLTVGLCQLFTRRAIRLVRSAAQDYCYMTGEANHLLTKYLGPTRPDKVLHWQSRRQTFDQLYTDVIRQTPRMDTRR